MCAMGTPVVQPRDLTKLGDYHSVQHMPQKEVTELYTSNQIVCVKDDKGGSEITLVLVCLQENAKVGIKIFHNFGFVNSVDKTKLSCNTPTDAAP